MSNTIPLINGEAYSWSQVTVELLQRKLEGITAINYSKEQVKTNNPGRGTKPISRGRGPKSYSGNITFAKEEIVAIQNAIPGKDLMDIKPFPVTITFDRDGIIHTDVLLYCEFMNDGVDMNTDSTNIETQINLIIGDIISS